MDQPVEKKESKQDGEMVTLKPNVICSEHYFEYISGTEVACTKCPLGYGLSPQSALKDGHIYIKEKLVI